MSQPEPKPKFVDPEYDGWFYDYPHEPLHLKDAPQIAIDVVKNTGFVIVEATKLATRGMYNVIKSAVSKNETAK